MSEQWPDLKVYIAVPLICMGFVDGVSDIQYDSATLF